MSDYNKLYPAILFIILMCAISVPCSARLAAYGIIFEANATPGEHISHNLTLSLSADETSPRNISVDLQDWYQLPNGANSGVENNPNMAPYSAKRFLTINPKTFSIGPGRSQTVKIEGDMPAGNGGRYAIVSIHPTPNYNNKGLSVSFAIDALVLLTIQGSNISRTGEIENVSLSGPASSKEKNGTFVFKNTGNYDYSFNTSVYLQNDKGNVLANSSQEIKNSIIPTSRREIKFTLKPESELKPGNYIIKVQAALRDGTMLATKETKFVVS